MQKLLINKVIRIIEQEVAEYYAKRLNEPMFLAVGYYKDYDCISFSRNLPLEIKFEEKARDTYNLALEVSYNGKPSGLTSTRAKKWVHIVPIDKERMSCYEFDVEALREVTRNFQTFWGGDGKKSEMKLLPLNEAEKIATKRFEFSIDWSAYQPYWE